MKYLLLILTLVVSMTTTAQKLHYSAPFNEVHLEFDSRHNAVVTTIQSSENYKLLEQQLSYAFKHILKKEESTGWEFVIPEEPQQDWGLSYDNQSLYEFNGCNFDKLGEARKYLVEYYLAIIIYQHKPEPEWKPRKKIKYYIKS